MKEWAVDQYISAGFDVDYDLVTNPTVIQQVTALFGKVQQTPPPIDTKPWQFCSVLTYFATASAGSQFSLLGYLRRMNGATPFHCMVLS